MPNPLTPFVPARGTGRDLSDWAGELTARGHLTTCGQRALFTIHSSRHGATSVNAAARSFLGPDSNSVRNLL